MKQFDDDTKDYRKRSKRANNIPGVGMKTINSYEDYEDLSDYEYDDNMYYEPDSEEKEV